jgi:hypothetical protein
MSIYNPWNGALFCDPAGTGVAAAVKIAVLTKGLKARSHREVRVVQGTT